MTSEIKARARQDQATQQANYGMMTSEDKDTKANFTEVHVSKFGTLRNTSEHKRSNSHFLIHNPNQKPQIDFVINLLISNPQSVEKKGKFCVAYFEQMSRCGPYPQSTREQIR
jgi:hypothetical protein